MRASPKYSQTVNLEKLVTGSSTTADSGLTTAQTILASLANSSKSQLTEILASSAGDFAGHMSTNAYNYANRNFRSQKLMIELQPASRTGGPITCSGVNRQIMITHGIRMPLTYSSSADYGSVENGW